MIKNRVGKWWRVLPSSQRHAGTDKFLIETDRAPNEKIPRNLMSTAYNSLAGGGILMWEKLKRNQFCENRYRTWEVFFTQWNANISFFGGSHFLLFFICSIDLLSSHLSWLFGKFRECNCLIWPQPHCLPLSASTTKSWLDLPKARLIVLVHGCTTPFPLLSKYVRLFESMECSSLNLFLFSKLTINLLFKIFLDYLELKMILVDEGILGCMGYDLFETNFKMRAAFGSNMIDPWKRLVMVSTACIANY